MGITLDSIKAKMVGKTFGKLTILEYAGKSERGDNLWLCQCECGTQITGRTASVDKPTSACSDCKRWNGPKAERLRTELLGKTFGRLKVVSFAGMNKHQNVMWKCQCECGNEITTRTSNLNSGVTTSCGCYTVDRVREASTKHGLYKHPLYMVWSMMKDRCYNPKSKSYKDYGGRGIKVCSEWVYSFKAFYDWAMIKGYEPGLTLDRENNNHGYFPANCRWVGQDVQSQNRRSNRVTLDQAIAIRYDPRPHTEIARDYGVDASTISRIKAHRTWGNV